MISYTIDPTVFIPPEIPVKGNEGKNYRKDLKKYLDTIEKCYQFIHNEGISVYVFHYYKNKFNDEYKSKASKYGLPVDLYKTRLDNILLFNMPKLHYGNRIGAKKYYFEDWFEIEHMKYSESFFKPKLESLYETVDITYRINLIGILNNLIYKTSSLHFLIINEALEHFLLETKGISFSINNNNYSEKSMHSKIKLKSISGEIHKTESKFNSVLDVYKYAKEQFKEFIIFGKDVESGIGTIRDSAGPPERVFTYLETLTEFVDYKRKHRPSLKDDKILQILGCICSYEDEEQMKIEKVKNARIFDNGSNEKILFNLHLKPSTYSNDIGNRKRTIRIYISWDEDRKIVIVGWIGEHL